MRKKSQHHFFYPHHRLYPIKTCDVAIIYNLYLLGMAVLTRPIVLGV